MRAQRKNTYGCFGVRAHLAGAERNVLRGLRKKLGTVKFP